MPVNIHTPVSTSIATPRPSIRMIIKKALKLFNPSRVSSRIFCLGCKDQLLCVKHAKFLTFHMPILEYQSPMHESQSFYY